MGQSRQSAFDVRMRGFRDRADLGEMIALIDGRLAPLGVEEIDIHSAAGRRLAEAVVAPVSVPGFVRSAMDGYAVRGEETFGASSYNQLPLRVIGQSLPGVPFEGTVGREEAVRIMTGAPLPAGSDAVLMAENARAEGETVFVSEPVAPGKNVGRVGEDIAAGALVLSPPRTLRPQDVAVCSAIGVPRLRVYRRPVISILITGNELLPAGSRPSGFHIADANSVLLRALAQRDGAIVEGKAGEATAILPDNRETIRTAIEQATGDCLLISGGSSVGQEDHAPGLVAELGELAIHGLALRPASPAGLGFIGTRPVFLMPGNPVSCLCAYDLFVGRAIRLLGGMAPERRGTTTTLPLARKLSSIAGRVDYARVCVRQGKVEPLAISGASILSSTTRADGYVIVPKDLEGYPEGALVTVHLYDLDD